MRADCGTRAALDRAAAAVSGRGRPAPCRRCCSSPTRSGRPIRGGSPRACRAGRGVVFRAFGAADAVETGRAPGEATPERGVVLLVGADAGWRARSAPTGVHLPERLVGRLPCAAARPGWIRHRRRPFAWSAALGGRAGLDAVFLSPVFASGSPSAAARARRGGWFRPHGSSRTPVYALGGVSGANGARSCMGSGACGLAAVTALADGSDVELEGGFQADARRGGGRAARRAGRVAVGRPTPAAAPTRRRGSGGNRRRPGRRSVRLRGRRAGSRSRSRPQRPVRRPAQVRGAARARSNVVLRSGVGGFGERSRRAHATRDLRRGLRTPTPVESDEPPTDRSDDRLQTHFQPFDPAQPRPSILNRTSAVDAPIRHRCPPGQRNEANERGSTDLASACGASVTGCTVGRRFAALENGLDPARKQPPHARRAWREFALSSPLLSVL